MIVSQIVAASENNVIGIKNRLPWRMPDDMAYFKKTTIGHHVIMGRRNYEAEGRSLPGRTNIIVTRNQDFTVKDAIVTSSIEEALEISKKNGEVEAFIVGGGEIYRQSMELTDRIYLTRIHTKIEGGEVFYPELDEKIWKKVKEEFHSKDEKNPFDYTFLVYERKN